MDIISSSLLMIKLRLIRFQKLRGTDGEDSVSDSKLPCFFFPVRLMNGNVENISPSRHRLNVNVFSLIHSQVEIFLFKGGRAECGDIVEL